MLRHACDVIGDPVLREGNFVFGDTDHHVRDLHRRRPVTKDKFPASWRLEDLATWLELPIPEQSHRAGADAKLTWEVLYHTMDRYGSDELLPRQQLVQRFFDEQGKQAVAAMAGDAPPPDTRDTDAAMGAALLKSDEEEAAALILRQKQMEAEAAAAAKKAA